MMIQTAELVTRTSTHSEGSQGQRRHRWQRASWLPREPSGGSPSLGGNSLDGQGNQSLQQSNQMRGFSGKHEQSGQAGRGFRVKVYLPTFKDEKAKDAMTNC